MPAIKQNFTLPKGDSRILRIPLVDGDGKPYVAPAGATAKFWAAPSADTVAAAVPIKKSVGSGVALDNTSPTQTVIVVTLSSADTSGLTPQDYYHETELTSSVGVNTVASGTMRLTKALIV